MIGFANGLGFHYLFGFIYTFGSPLALAQAFKTRDKLLA